MVNFIAAHQMNICRRQLRRSKNAATSFSEKKYIIGYRNYTDLMLSLMLQINRSWQNV